MRRLTYSVNGVAVDSYAEALDLANGNDTLVKAVLTDIPKPAVKRSPQREAARVKAVKP